MTLLDRKVAIITGGTSGIGARIAERFTAEGALVVIAGRRQEEGTAVARALGSSASFMRADVSVESDVEAVVQFALSRHGRLDVMVNNAGGPGHWGNITEIDLQVFRELQEVHVGGVLAGIKHAARAMLENSSGSIINMASVSGHRAGWSGVDYSVAKAAILHLTRCAAIELGESGIRVNSISPGVVLTGIFGKGAGMDPATADRTADGLAALFPSLVGPFQPIERPTTTDDITGAAVWLAGDQSTMVTGHDVVIDGGISAGRPIKVSRAERQTIAAAMTSRTANQPGRSITE